MVSNYIYVLLYNLITCITPLMVTPYLSKTLGETNLGIYEFVTSVTVVFSLLANTGFALYAKREVAINRDDQGVLNVLYTELSFWHLIQGLLSSLLFFLYILIYSEYKNAFFMALFGVLVCIVDNSWLYAGLDKFNIVSIRGILMKLFMLVGVFLFVNTKDDLPTYVGVMYGANLIVTIVYFLYGFKYVRFVKVDITKAFRHFAPALCLMIPGVMTTLYSTIDTILLGKFSTMEQNGYYGQAHKIIVLIISFTTAIGAVIMPSMAYDNHHGKADKLKELATSAIDVMCMVALPAICGLWVTMDGITPWLFDEKFIGIESIIKMFLPLILLEGVSDIVGTQLMTAKGQDKQLMGINFVFIITDVILDMMLMPAYGAFGGVVATILAISVKTMIILFVCRDSWSFYSLFKSILKYMVPSVIMAAAVLLVKNNYHVNSYFMNSVIQVSLGFILYMGLLFITKNEWMMILLEKIMSRIITRRQ